MIVYDFELSGNCYKVRLFLSLLDKKYQSVLVDLPAKAQNSPEFLALNPRGQVPVLVDESTIVWDSMAILVYLAKKYGAGRWLPEDANALASVMQWLAVSENEILYGLARARGVLKFGHQFDFTASKAIGEGILKIINNHLGEHEWLAGMHPTIADLACYPYIALAPEARIDLSNYETVIRWMGQIEELAGYVPMPGIYSVRS